MKLLNRAILIFAVLTLFSLGASGQKIVEAKDKYAKFGDIKVNYLDIGEGKNALVFVHGWTCNKTFWKRQYGGFPGKRRVFVDLPGHGKSDRPQADYTIEYFARAVEAVIKHAKIKKAVIIGHSMGTPVARNFYKLFPDKTAGIVVVDGALRPNGNKEETNKYIVMFKADYQKTASMAIDSMMPTASTELKQEIKTGMLGTPEFVAISAMENMMKDENYPQEKIGVPVMVVLAKSPFWAADTEDFLKSKTTTLDFNWMTGVSHFLMLEKPAEFNTMVNNFLTKNKLP